MLSDGAVERCTAGVLSGKVAVITGASAGLGAALAAGLAGAGASVALVGRRGADLARVAASIDGAVAVQADITSEGEREAMVAAVRDRLGPVDILVNNAGVAVAGVPLQHERIGDVERMVATNLVGPLHLCQLAFPDLRRSGDGVIVNIGSIAGRAAVGRIPQAAYAATKGAVHALTREAAVQWARYGIRVNAIAPGFFQSELTQPLYGSISPLLEWVDDRQPLKRRSVPEDYIGAAVFLASDASRHVTGQVLYVDGGWTAA